MKMSGIKEKNRASLKERHKRPDKQLYVPRALRKVESVEVSESKSLNFDTNSLSVNTKKNKSVDQPPSSSSGNIEIEDITVLNCDKLKVSENITDQCVHKFSASSNKVKQHSPMIKDSIIMDENICIKNTDKFQDIAENTVNIDCLAENFHEKVPKDIPENLCVKSDEILPTGGENVCNSNNPIKLKNDFEDAKKVNNDLNSKQLRDVLSQAKNDKFQTHISATDDSWETMFNDDGECLDPKILKELRDITGHMEVTIAKNDYSSYETLSRSASEEYSNIVELSGFPVEFNTQDLTSAFSMFQAASYVIKWVDDCHALAIFSSPVIANQALHLTHPFIKARPVSEGIKQSQEKAKFCSQFCEAPKPRPATTAVLARRLVTGALGLKLHTSKEQRDIERNMLRDAKEKKKLKAKRRQDIWDGIVS